MQRVFGFVLLALGIVVLAVGGIMLIVQLVNPGGLAVEWMLVAGFVAVGGLVLLLLAWQVLRRSKPLGTSADGDVIDGAHHQYIANQTQTALLLDRFYTTLYQPPVKGKNGKPSLLRVSAPTPCPVEFAITRQNWFDRLALRIGLALEISSGDAQFDAERYLRTDAIEFIQKFVDDPAKREAILELRRLGFTEIALRDGEFQANWTSFDPATNDQPDLLVEAAAHLFIFSENLPETAPAAEDGPARRRLPRYIALWVLQLVLAPAFLFVFWYKPVFTSELIVATLPIVIPAYLVFGLLAYLLLRGSPISHDRWAKLIGAGLIVFSLGGVGAVAAGNAMFDPAQPKLHRVTVIDKRSTRSRNSTTYYVECASWRGGGDNVEFTVSSSEHQRVVLGQSQMEVTVAPGRLGVEWIVERHLILQPRKR